MTGIVSFVHPEQDLAAVYDRLGNEGIVTSLRQKRDGTNLLRVSAHCYNTETELDRLLDVIGSE